MQDCMNTVSDFGNVREAVCVSIQKIMDACRDQDCMEDLAVYLILVSAILQALPQESYQKYIRFFSGLVLIILLMTPLLRLTDMEDSFRSRVQEQNMEQESASFLEEIREKQEEGKGEMTLETEEKEQIEVEEIQIGE